LKRLITPVQRLFFVLLLPCAGLFFFPLGLRALWDSDEGRYAEIAREMLAAHRWLVPHLNGVLYFEKPPLTYWLTTLGLSVFGVNPFGARFFSALFGLLTVFLVFRIGRYWKNERTGLLAGVVLATSTAFFFLTQYLVVDMVLTFWLTLALDAGLHIQHEESRPAIRKNAFLFAAAIAGAFLTKGLIALLLPGAIFGLSFTLRRSVSQLKKIPWVSAGCLFLLITAPWFLWMSSQFHFFPFFFFIHEHFARYFTQVHQRAGPIYYFIPVLLVGFLPWIFFLPAIFKFWLKDRGAALRRDGTGLTLFLWAGFIFVFFSFSGSKLPSYMLPVFPALALLIARFFEERLDAPETARSILWGLDAFILFFMSLLVLLKWVPGPAFLTDPLVTTLIEHGSLLALILALCVLILVGVWGMRKPAVAFGGILATQVIFLSSLAAVAPVLDPWLSTQTLAQIIATRAAPADRVVVYGVSYETYTQSLAFYTQRRIAIYGPPGELSLGKEHAADAADWFAEGEAANDALKRVPVGTWVMTDQEYLEKIRALELQQDFEIVERSGRLILLQKTQ